MVIVDVPGAYINAKIPEDGFILEEQFMDIICEVKHKHKKNICVDNVAKLLYILLMKALCGYMDSAILWCDLYSKTLKSQGFLINPYDRCIANITIKDKQCTIVWYVDNNKVSLVDEVVNTKVI